MNATIVAGRRLVLWLQQMKRNYCYSLHLLRPLMLATGVIIVITINLGISAWIELLQCSSCSTFSMFFLSSDYLNCLCSDYCPVARRDGCEFSCNMVSKNLRKTCYHTFYKQIKTMVRFVRKVSYFTFYSSTTLCSGKPRDFAILTLSQLYLRWPCLKLLDPICIAPP